MPRRVVQKGEFELVNALAAGSSVAEAAERAGVSTKTIYRRLGEPEFKAKITVARDALFADAVGKLADASSAAIATLVDLLSSSSPSAQLGAARAILGHGPKLRDQVELENRITLLEETQNAK